MYALALDHGHHVRGVEAPHFVLNHHRAAGVERLKRGPMPGAVHERRRGQRLAMAGGGAFDITGQAVDHHAVRAPRPKTRDEDVLVLPQHALGHAGGAAGVDDVKVVRVPRHVRLGRAGRGERRLERHGAVEQRPFVVLHLQQQFQGGHLRANGVYMSRQGAVEDQRPRPRVVQEIDELRVHIAVVHVERRHPRLVRAHHRFQVLVAVVQVDAQVILAGLPIRKRIPLGVQAEAAAVQIVGEPARAVGEFAVADAPVAKDDRLAIRHRLGDGLVYGGEVEVQGLPLGVCAAPPMTGK